MKQKSMKVEGMSCGNCEKAVTDAVTPLPGVSQVVADAEADQVTVSWEKKEPDWEAVRQVIYAQGFDVVG